MLNKTPLLFVTGLAVAFFWLLCVAITYFYHFGDLGFSNDPAAWGQFGDYLGGVANPFFGLLTLMALSVSLFVQTKQLSITSEELKLTREELGRSAKIQKLSEEALRAQANASEQSVQLATINLLLDHYSNEFNRLIEPKDHAQLQEKIVLMGKKSLLASMLDTMYLDVIKTNK
jgi:1,4-dihydroxy-2-naphthoate octaprenyltransferase